MRHLATRVFVVGFALASLTAGGAEGLERPGGTCTCMSPKRPTCEVWWQTSAIFVGRVTRIRTVSEQTSDGKKVSKLVNLRIDERWQGVQGLRDVEIGTGAGGGDCGFDFEQGETYLVYAGQSAVTGRLETGICTRTALISEAEADLAYLRALETADKVVSMYGMVYRERERLLPGLDPDRKLDPGGPLPGVQIDLRQLNTTGEGVEITTTTDSEGWYEIEELRPGRYEIRLTGEDVGPDGLWRFRIPVGPACIWRNIIVDPAAEVEGTDQRQQSRSPLR